MLKNEKGFTVMEVVVVMIAMSVVTLAVAPFIRLNVDSYIHVRDAKYNLQTARISFNKIFNEIRRINSPNNLARTSSDRLGFYLPSGAYVEYRYVTDSDGNPWIARTPVRWFPSQSDYEPLIGGVQSFRISYLDKGGNTAASTSDIHRIRIYLLLQDPDNEDIQLSFVDQSCINRF